MRFNIKHLVLLMAIAGLVSGVVVVSYEAGKKAGEEDGFLINVKTFTHTATLPGNATKRSTHSLLDELLGDLEKNL